MIRDKEEILRKLRDEFAAWEQVLPTLTAVQATTPRHPAPHSLKDEVAHLYGWQQISRAHVRAAVEDAPPRYPEWPVEIVPGDEGDVNQINAWIYQRYADLPWASVCALWRAGFEDFLTLVAAVPEGALFDAHKYPWLGGYRLLDVLTGSYEHHQEHRAELLAWLQAQDSSH